MMVLRQVLFLGEHAQVLPRGGGAGAGGFVSHGERNGRNEGMAREISQEKKQDVKKRSNLFYYHYYRDNNACMCGRFYRTKYQQIKTETILVFLTLQDTLHNCFCMLSQQICLANCCKGEVTRHVPA